MECHTHISFTTGQRSGGPQGKGSLLDNSVVELWSGQQKGEVPKHRRADTVSPGVLSRVVITGACQGQQEPWWSEGR